MDEKYELEIYETRDKKRPFEVWIEQIRDLKVVAKLQSRLGRAILGNLGDHKFVKDGVFELRVDFGPGYRIYFGRVGRRIVLLLCGGTKNSQNPDIEKAVKYLQDYLARGKEYAKK